MHTIIREDIERRFTMNFFDLFRYFLILIVPGIVAAVIYGFIANRREEPRITTALIFDLFIFIINITGLYFFKGIVTVTLLLASFDCLSFTRRYALLSLLVGSILASIAGLIRRLIRF